MTKTMSNDEAKNFIDSVFSKIKESMSIQDLKNIPEKLLFKSEFNEDLYPKIEFKINKEDIQSLIENKRLDDEYNFTPDLSSNLEDPLTKLLYAALWKNGDLKKIQHIIKGIVEVGKEDTNQESAIVFYQFGKYLTKTQSEPIIDQHVIRAFAMYRPDPNDDISKIQSMKVINKKHNKYIKAYKNWLMSNELQSDLKEYPDHTYHIDKILFAAGKTIKQA